jgi:ubiquinone/menaquinone biosynthesis C-methylase UbiE
MSSRSAEIYDAVYSFKDYTAEAEAVHKLIQNRCATARTLLDVACGTGKHLERLNASYQASISIKGCSRSQHSSARCAFARS